MDRGSPADQSVRPTRSGADGSGDGLIAVAGDDRGLGGRTTGGKQPLGERHRHGARRGDGGDHHISMGSLVGHERIRFQTGQYAAGIRDGVDGATCLLYTSPSPRD